MYVCLCNGVTEAMIQQAAAAGVSSLSDLTAQTGCAAGCGSCAEEALTILRAARATRHVPWLLQPVMVQAAA
ncbi:MAG: (2Fe-2S)-binding protein [Xanthomonadales bacterium]|nr:(2Fe-2S)-binding protein [Xanthomonadales bacterium]MCB1636270.1 (2Fe-2S)-binding protein [Xanthomonadales bacterium]MCB1640720.1 (2Fe-2S)-binding protein [Xanthomonadales bacterium]